MHLVQISLYTSLSLLGKHTSDMLRVNKPDSQRSYLSDGLMFEK